ncbi:MAG: hypothetical protein V3R29_10320, partial [Candidatus Acidoferrales bacterium]
EKSHLADTLQKLAQYLLHFGDAVVLVADSISAEHSKSSLDEAAAETYRSGGRLFHFNVEKPWVIPPTRFSRPGALVPGAFPVPEEPSHLVTYETWKQWNRGVSADKARELIEKTGGMTIDIWRYALYVPHRGLQFPEPQEAVSAGVQELYELLGPVYRLELRLERPLKKKRKLKLEVLNEQGKKRRDLRLHHPPALYPPDSPAD